MPRNAFGALVNCAIGLVFLAVAGALLGWVWLSHTDLPRAFDAALWAFRQSPFALSMDPVHFGNRIINRPWPTFMTFLGILTSLPAIFYLRAARRATRPAHVSDDGRARLELKGAAPRAGRPLEGAVLLGRKASAGDKYTLTLECRKMAPGANETVEMHYEKSIDVLAVASVNGASLPFRFDIPMTALPSRAWKPFGPSSRDVWDLAFKKPKSWFGSMFPLHVAGAPEEEVRAVAYPTIDKLPAQFQWKLPLWIAAAVVTGGLLLTGQVDALISYLIDESRR